MNDFKYKCTVLKNGSKRYYQKDGGKWKIISNEMGKSVEKGKRKYMGKPTRIKFSLPDEKIREKIRTDIRKKEKDKFVNFINKKPYGKNPWNFSILAHGSMIENEPLKLPHNTRVNFYTEPGTCHYKRAYKQIQDKIKSWSSNTPKQSYIKAVIDNSQNFFCENNSNFDDVLCYINPNDKKFNKNFILNIENDKIHNMYKGLMLNISLGDDDEAFFENKEDSFQANIQNFTNIKKQKSIDFEGNHKLNDLLQTFRNIVDKKDKKDKKLIVHIFSCLDLQSFGDIEMVPYDNKAEKIYNEYYNQNNN